MSHSPFILNIRKDSGEDISTADKAQEFARSFLEENSFVGSGGHCDWYYVGVEGRFTELIGGDGAVRFSGQAELLELCQKLAEDGAYLDSECELMLKRVIGW